MKVQNGHQEHREAPGRAQRWRRGHVSGEAVHGAHGVVKYRRAGTRNTVWTIEALALKGGKESGSMNDDTS